MAKLILDSNESFTIAAGNSADIIGDNTAQTVTLQPGASVEFIGFMSGDTIKIAGNAANYTAVSIGSTVTLTDSITGATIAIPAGFGVDAAAALEFDDGVRDLWIDDSGDAPAIKLGDDTVTGEAAQLSGETNTPTAPGAPGEGETFSLTTGTDAIVGTSGNDAISGTSETFQAGDAVIDQSATDSDTLNLTLTAAPAAATVTGIENINVNINSTAVDAFNADTYAGVKNLTVTRGDVLVGGSTIQGNKTITVNRVDATKIEKITAGAATTTVDVDQSAATLANSKAGVTVDASTATGAVTVTGAATILANNSTGNIVVNGIAGAAAAEQAKAVSVEAAKAAYVDVNANIKGAITINAAVAKQIDVADAAGGVTVNAEKGATTGFNILGVDDSGATVTTGAYTKTAPGTVTLGGTSGTTDAATVTAAGYINLASNSVEEIENLNLSGNGAAVTYTLTGTPTATTLSGTQDVTLKGTSAQFTGKTVTDATTAGTTSVELTTVTTADLSKVGADKIVLAGDSANGALDFATGANISLAKDQTGLTIGGKEIDATVNVAVADDTNADGTEIDLTVGALNLATNVKVANIDATVGKFTATGTTATGGTTGTTINVSGTKDVALGTVVAKEVNASGLSGKLNLTSAATATITGGTGADTIVLDDTDSLTTKFTVNAGDGNNIITIDNAKEASLISAGAGNDQIAVNTAAAIVVAAGAGTDTVTIKADIDADAVLVGGDGSDKLVFADTDGNDFSNNTNFSFAAFEELNISALTAGAITISGAQFNGQTFTVKGDATADTLAIVGKADTDNVINASTITVDTATVSIKGANKVDTLTGTASADTFVATTGADVISGGSGNDTYDASALGIDGTTAIEGTGTGNQTGVVVNLSGSAIASTTIVAAGTGYTANTITTVDAGKTAYLYAAAATTNSAVQQTLSSVENITGTGGNDYLVGSAGANVINGGAANDYIVGGKGADILTGGAGDDTFVISLTGDTGSTFATADTITDFKVAGADTISTGVAASATNFTVASQIDGTSFATEAAALTAADTVLDGTVAYAVVYNYNGTGNGYLYYDADGDVSTGLSIIALTGVGTSSDVVAADIVA